MSTTEGSPQEKGAPQASEFETSIVSIDVDDAKVVAEENDPESDDVEATADAKGVMDISSPNEPSTDEALAPADQDASPISKDELQIQIAPMKETPHSQPLPVVRRQPSPPSSSAVIYKFSYEPRASESAYYQGLFNYVASFLHNGNHNQAEVILPPKLVAEKLFLASKIPSEKLRVIWNMATAVKSMGSDEGSVTACAIDESLVSSKCAEESNPKLDSMASGTDSKTSGDGCKDNVSITNKGTLVVMTQAQFNTTVRLIQLFQNRTSALDAQLKWIDMSKLTHKENMQGKGAFMQGKLVKFDEDGLLPAYFAGISGVILAMPGSSEYKAADATLPQTKRNSTFSIRRRTVDDDEADRSIVGGVRRRTVTGEMQGKGTNELRMKRIEKEIVQLRTAVQSLLVEVGQLKSALPNGDGDMTRVISSPALATNHAGWPHQKNGFHHRPGSDKIKTRYDKATVSSIDTLRKSARANLIGASETARQVKDESNHTANTNQQSSDDDAPNTGVESFWGSKDATRDSNYPVKLVPSLQYKVKDLSRQAKGRAANNESSLKPKISQSVQNKVINLGQQARGRIAVREVASFDPTNPPNVSSNIPAVHPSAKRQIIRVQPKIHEAPQSREPLSQAPADLRQSGSTSGNNGSGNLRILRSSVGSNGQTSPGMISNPNGDFNTAVVKSLRSSVGNTGQPKEDFNASLGSIRSSASISRQSMKSILKGGKHLPLSSGNAQPISVEYVPKRNDPSRLSVHSAATAPRINGSRNIAMSANPPPDVTSAKSSPRNEDDPSSARRTIHKQNVASARPARRLTRDALTASIRHIVRNKDGTTHVYQEKETPPSTNATDVKPLEPAPMSANIILNNTDNSVKPKKKSILVRRLSTN